MRKRVLLYAACITIMNAAAQTPAQGQDFMVGERTLRQAELSYLENVFSDEPWNSNWFLSAKGGVSAFLGKPIGHGDLFDRKKEMLNAAVGKWFTPSIGGRIAYQGMYLIDSDMEARAYTNLHADLLYNVAAHFRRGGERQPKWDVVPYVGCGIIHNSYTKDKPFAFSGGVITRYRVAKRLHLAAEVGATTTWQSFDGKGNPDRPGDNLLHASIGLDYTIGKTGWKRVIDPEPLVLQNDMLMEYHQRLRIENDRINRLHARDEMALKEMRKILEIEGLLGKYSLAQEDEEEIRTRPHNNYSGLNSLRARLRSKDRNGEEDDFTPATRTDSLRSCLDNVPAGEYFQLMKDGTVFVGAPVFFFFQLASDELTEKAQIINLKEMAKVIKKYGLFARVVGAADSQTGTASGNERLSAQRADHIAGLLKEQGIPESKITTQYRGGINTYEPQTGNRNTCVMLYFNTSGK